MANPKMERTQHSLITDGVTEQEQTLATEKPFWVFFVANLGIGTWLVGVLIAGLGLNFADAMFVILFGSIIGSALVGALATLGPLTRLSQIEIGRLSLGRVGKKAPAFLNWLGAIGWDAITNILAASALLALADQFGFSAPYWLALGLLAGTQLLVGIYGHHLIQETSKYTGILLGLLFVVIGIIAMHKSGGAPTPETVASPKNIISALAILVSNNAGGWGPFAADYTRYLPKRTPSRLVFFSVFLALFLTLVVFAFFGYMTASTVSEQSPNGVMKALVSLTGRFSPIVLFLVAFNSIPVNAINDNSAAYSLMSMGFKISRLTAAVIGGVISYTICILASNSFVEFFENFLFLLIHWVGPWSAVLLVHWYMVGQREQKTPSGITRGAVIFGVVTLASVVLFSSNSLYTGLLSDAVEGMDIGPYLGFLTAGAAYYASLRFWPGKYRALKVT